MSQEIIEVEEVIESALVEVGQVTSPSLVVQREVINFDRLMEMSTMLAKSTIVPVMYQNRPENIFISLDLASRMGVPMMMVMQNLYIINGKPSWSGQAMASMIRANPEFKDVELHFVGTEGKDDWGAYVTAINTKTGKLLKGGTVTIGISRKEGWYQKSGSKWQTIPELMLSYRAYSWFGRVYCPELLMGLQSSEEVEDVTTTKTTVANPYANK